MLFALKNVHRVSLEDVLSKENGLTERIYDNIIWSKTKALSEFCFL